MFATNRINGFAMYLDSFDGGGVEQSIVGKISALGVLLKYLSQNKRRWTLDTTTN
jgi:hypothetical protein